MARKRTLTRHCALCDKVLYGFDDDMELGALHLGPDHELAPFSGAYMCAGCFENWPKRTAYGQHRLDYVRSELDSKARAEIFSDEKCLLLVEMKIEVQSWNPVKIEHKGVDHALLYLGQTGTELHLGLKSWGSEMPTTRGEKRLLPCEQVAIEEVWDNLVRHFPTGDDLVAGVDVDDVVTRHRVWLECTREKA